MLSEEVAKGANVVTTFTQMIDNKEVLYSVVKVVTPGVINGYGMTITSTAVAMILGIIMNLILKDKKEEKPAAPEAAE